MKYLEYMKLRKIVKYLVVLDNIYSLLILFRNGKKYYLSNDFKNIEHYFLYYVILLVNCNSNCINELSWFT